MKPHHCKMLLWSIGLSLGLSGVYTNPTFAQSTESEGQTAKEEYLTGCVQGAIPERMSLADLSPAQMNAARAFCGCTLEGFMELYPNPDDFIATVNQIQEGGQTPEAFLNVLQTCLPK